MEYTEFGKTQLRVSRICLGTWGIGGAGWDSYSDESRMDAIKAAVDCGINSATVFYARSEMGAVDPVGLCSGNGSYDLWNARRRHFNRKIQRTQGIWCG